MIMQYNQILFCQDDGFELKTMNGCYNKIDAHKGISIIKT